jgi:DNA-binding MarR family transcriptional regulator
MKKVPISYFSDEVLRIMPSLMRNMDRKQSDALLKGQITIPQFLALDLIDRKGSLKMKEIAEFINVSLPAATGLVNRLFNHDLVKRETSSKDRRIIKILLSNKGKTLIHKVRIARKRDIEDIFGQLTDRERAEYLDILKKVMRILSARKEKRR